MYIYNICCGKYSRSKIAPWNITISNLYLHHRELLGQAWMKPDKSQKATQVLLVSKRFNEVSRLVVSEIVRRQSLADRVACIEKWAAIADICRCMHNYNGVLQICAAFVNSSVYRLKKTWEKISKQVCAWRHQLVQQREQEPDMFDSPKQEPCFLS